MRKNYLFFGVILVVAIFLIAIFPPPSGDLSVKLEIHDMFPKSILIQNDGTVIFTEFIKVKDRTILKEPIKQTNQTKISNEKIELLKQFILKNNFFSLNEKYMGTGCCDFVAHTITVTIGNKTHSVYCYNECPEKFDKIKERIKNIWPYKIEYIGFA